MDAQETLVIQASIVAVVLARGSDLELVELTGKPDAVDQSAALINAGFKLHGLVGLTDGRIEIAPNNPLDVACMFAMGGAVRLFGQLVAALPQKDDSVS